jgi:hypothetical protein
MVNGARAEWDDDMVWSVWVLLCVESRARECY